VSGQTIANVTFVLSYRDGVNLRYAVRAFHELANMFRVVLELLSI
jgi:hypothetical protein